MSVNAEFSDDMAKNSCSYVATVATITAVVVSIAAGFYLLRKRKAVVPNIRVRTVKGPITLADPQAKYSLKLIKKIEVSHDTRRFVFALPTEKHVLGLPVGQHINVIAKIADKLVIRPYTPVSSDDDLGVVEFVIKVYFKDTHPKFPAGGKMSQYLENMNIGDHLDFRGPVGAIIYQGNGYFKLHGEKRSDPPVTRHFHELGLIAGGTGITPMLQVIYDVLKAPEDPTKMALLFANQSEADILLKNELDRLAAEHPTRFRVWYTIDRPTDGWQYSTGFVNAKMIGDYLPVVTPAGFRPRPDAFGCEDDFSAVLMCGPPGMLQFAVHPSLTELGFPERNRFAF